MAASASAGEVPAATARRLAQDILAEGRFHKASVPRPLHDTLREIGRVLESPLNALDELVHKIGSGVPGGTVVVWSVLALAVMLASAAASLRHARKALRESPSASGDAHASGRLSAAELERLAVEAERAGRYGEAVRYRFRAGLVRLAETGIVRDAPSTVNAEVARTLGSRDFGRLAARFDEITYGRGAAREDDVRLSRDVWEQVLKARPR